MKNKIFYKKQQINKIDTIFGKLKLISIKQIFSENDCNPQINVMDLSRYELLFECGLRIEVDSKDLEFEVK